MAKGTKTPGVSYFHYESMPNKGKAHPERIGPGLAGNRHVTGRNPSVSDFGSGSASSPARELDGKENRGTTSKCMQAPVGMPGGMTKQDSLPSGVRKHSGTRAPKSIK